VAYGEASLRAAEQLKITWPKLSAATLKLPVRMIPLLVGLLAVATIVVVPGVTVLAIVVALPAAFRIWIVLYPVPPPSKSVFVPRPKRKNPSTPSSHRSGARQGLSISC
jgi:hypothetical protein